MQQLETIELHQLKAVDFSELEKLFSLPHLRKLRIEMLQEYCVDYEVEFLEQYRAGKLPNISMMKEWCEMVSAFQDTDGLFQRVRFLKRPLSAYTKFEISWGYQYSVAAGEKIHVLDIKNLSSFVGMLPYLCDYWLIGDEKGYLMIYDFIGSYIGILEIPDAWMPHYVNFANNMLNDSVDIRDTELLSNYDAG